ncbi:hypothetical protein BKA70DRAFT_1578490 [Coprinopsis sp. MPI-PUGE-AT-0042]|nr:hypothetical protein BKA70DRAFT_1578490 [Coprinopsis sp. MPI-PUGE-AT-0042]
MGKLGAYSPTTSSSLTIIMEGTNPEPGTYALINSQLTRYALDTNNGIAVAYPYIASASQQWSLSTPDGIFWHVKNVESGRFLGLPVDVHVQNSVALQEVEYKFSWHIRRHEQHQNKFYFYVPYSRHVVDISPEKMKPGSEAFIHQDGQGLHQTWHLCRDLHLSASSALNDGDVYKLVNAFFHMSMTFRVDSKEVSCAPLALAENPHCRAIKRTHGWAFQNIRTERYLGIPHTVVHPDEPTLVSTVENPFIWMIIPHHADRSKFKICLPFTSRILGTQTDTLVCLVPNSEEDPSWWGFELSHEAASSPLQVPPESDESSKELILGPKEPSIASTEESNLYSVVASSSATAQPNTEGDSIPWSTSSVDEGIKPDKPQGSAQGGTSGSRSAKKRGKKAKKNVVVPSPSNVPKGDSPSHPTSSKAGSGEWKLPIGMTETQAKQSVAVYVQEFFKVRSVDKAETYFERIPAQYHKDLVEKLTITGIKSMASDTFLVSAVFKRASTKGLCSDQAFERAFMDVASNLKNSAMADPRAPSLFMMMVMGAQLDADARARIAPKNLTGRS